MACKDRDERLNFELEAYRMKLSELMHINRKEPEDSEVKRLGGEIDRLIDRHMEKPICRR